MISFYPGPSQPDAGIKEYLKDAFDESILSLNHRSEEFISLYGYLEELLKKKLFVPEGYKVVFTSSATEWWEIIAQSLTDKTSVHLGNGAFAYKWHQWAKAILPQSEYIEYDLQACPNPDMLKSGRAPELIALIQNETSNGTQVPDFIIGEFKAAFQDSLIAVDATSSMGGIHLDFNHADVWFASVQKCFGLPAGLGLGILSPRAIEKAKAHKETARYNSLATIIRNAEARQTHYTPNVLGIYLLMRVLQKRRKISKIDTETRSKAAKLYAYFDEKGSYQPLIHNKVCRSETVLCLKVDQEKREKLFEKAKAKGLSIGKGYGAWKEETFRIANFPAHSGKMAGKLLRFFDKI
jgi:phosphoserine aminotransferase